MTASAVSEGETELIVLTIRMKRHSRHRMHVRLSNVLDHDRDIVIPRPNTLVVGCSHETSVIVHPGNRIDGTEMLIVFLCNFFRS